MNEGQRHALVLTCEHASNAWPRRWGEMPVPAASVLKSHLGWDPGAYELARSLSKRLRAPLLAGKWSRLLIELNRSRNHPRLFSTYTRALPGPVRQKVLDSVYEGFRRQTLETIKAQVREGLQVIHLSVHSFVPQLAGRVRDAEIGLLYDPRRSMERSLCDHWRQRLRESVPGFRIRFNYPYRGTADGHTTALRKVFPESDYVGIELEVNQRLLRKNCRALPRLHEAVSDSLGDALKLGNSKRVPPSAEHVVIA